MDNLTWEQKLEALQNIAEVSLKMRKPRDWYVCMDAGIKQGSMLVGKYGNGANPIEAVEDHWNKYVTNLPANECIVVDAMDPQNRKQYRWAGYMWKEVN